MSKSVYFVSNNKKPNLYYRMVKSDSPVYLTRKEARLKLKWIKATFKGGKYYKIFKVSAVSVR
jgi:hypothetical protein